MKQQKTSSRMPLARPPLERMMRIHGEIQSGKFPNAQTLAADLEVSTKSIYRDLEFMQDRLKLPVGFDRFRNGYFYTEDVGAFPTMQITEGEIFALIVAEKAVRQYRGTTFEKPLLSAVKKLSAALPDTISVNLADLEQTVSFRTSAEPVLNLSVFDALAKATSRRQRMELIYRKPGAAAPEPRLVDPYHLANINGEWFLFAYDHGRKDIRTFVPSRIQEVRPTGETFARREFSVEQRLRGSFGVHSAEGRYEVVVRFAAAAADYIREKRWHASQELCELKGGGVELRLKLSSLAEIQRWILGWGGNAKVIAPAELAESVRAAARRILEG